VENPEVLAELKGHSTSSSCRTRSVHWKIARAHCHSCRIFAPRIRG
jgi:hypothetical protein